MRERLDPSQLQERERRQVQVAISLVADGRYPGIIIANLPDARFIAHDLVPDARLRGVQITLPGNADGSGCDIEVRRL
jgi:hypothetical protein